MMMDFKAMAEIRIIRRAKSVNSGKSRCKRAYIDILTNQPVYLKVLMAKLMILYHTRKRVSLFLDDVFEGIFAQNRCHLAG